MQISSMLQSQSCVARVASDKSNPWTWMALDIYYSKNLADTLSYTDKSQILILRGKIRGFWHLLTQESPSTSSKSDCTSWLQYYARLQSQIKSCIPYPSLLHGMMSCVKPSLDTIKILFCLSSV